MPSEVAAVGQAWAARVHAEYRSATLTQQLGHHWLVAGFSPDLIADSHRVVQDELRHAADAAAVLAHLGLSAPPLSESALSLSSSGLSAREAGLLGALRLLALNESLAVPLFAAMRKRATEPLVKSALSRISRDEPRHAALGWTALAWACEVWPDARPFLQLHLADAIAGISEAYRAAPDDHWSPNDPRWAWGLIDGATYAAVLDRFLANALPARLAELELRP